MHRWLPIAAPLTALALLTAACGVVDSGDPIPSVSPPGSPALKRVWQIPTKTVHPDGATAVGNVVLAPDAHDNGKTVFIDGTNGRIRGRAVTSPVRSLLGPATYATTDARGRPLVEIDETRSPSGDPYRGLKKVTPRRPPHWASEPYAIVTS